MKVEILKCDRCEKHTLEKVCKDCNNRTITTKPAKFSPEDKYGHYRRMVKKQNDLEN